MCKKIVLVSVFFIVSIFSKAQVASIEYPSGYLSEERINQILEHAKKDGASEISLKTRSEMLHNLLRKQNEEGFNNQTNNDFNKKTIHTTPNVLTTVGCVNPGFENGTTSNWTFTQASCINSSGTYNLPCPQCLDAAQNGVTTAGAT